MSEWTKGLPDDQCDWWWWDEDPDSAPILVSILYSHPDSYFAASGQHGWNIWQSVESMGGYWMKAVIPPPPK